MEFVLTSKLVDNLVFCDLPCLFQLHLLRVRLGFWKLKLVCCLGVSKNQFFLSLFGSAISASSNACETRIWVIKN